MAQARSLAVHERQAWVISMGVAALVFLSSLYIVFAGLDEGEVERATGSSIAEITAFNPAIVDFIARLERLIAVTGLGASGLAVSLILVGRRGESFQAWLGFWVFVAMLLGDAAVFLASGAAQLGWYYLGLGLVVAVAHGLSYRRFA